MFLKPPPPASKSWNVVQTLDSRKPARSLHQSAACLHHEELRLPGKRKRESTQPFLSVRLVCAARSFRWLFWANLRVCDQFTYFRAPLRQIWHEARRGWIKVITVRMGKQQFTTYLYYSISSCYWSKSIFLFFFKNYRLHFMRIQLKNIEETYEAFMSETLSCFMTGKEINLYQLDRTTVEWSQPQYREPFLKLHQISSRWIAYTQRKFRHPFGLQLLWRPRHHGHALGDSWSVLFATQAILLQCCIRP
jgi:hypothetical protein